MSYMRVLVLELPSSISWTGMMKIFRATTEPGLKAYKKQKVIANWSFVQIGDHTGLLIINFPNRAAMNNYLRTMAAVRRDIQADTGMQSWIYHGAVKASG